jgi:hypothetical protein
MVDSEAQKLRGAVSRSLARQVDSAHGNRIAMRCRLVGVALQQSSIAQEFQEVSLLLVPPKSQRRTSSTDPECHSTRHSPCGGTHWLRGAGLRQAAARSPACSLLHRIISDPTETKILVLAAGTRALGATSTAPDPRAPPPAISHVR